MNDAVKKTDPALLKLELFCRGMKVDPACDLSGARPLLRTRGGLGSGLEVVLPGGLYVNVPVEEKFAAASPFTLVREGDGYAIRRDGGAACPVTLPRRPAFYDRKTSSGKTMSRIAVMQGTYLAVYSSRVCEFWKMNPRMNCRFCSVGLNVGVTEETEKGVRDVVETARAARDEERITFVHFNTGFLWGGELDILEPYIMAVKRETGLLVGVQCPPAPDLAKYDRLRKLGVDHVSFCVELHNESRFREICPGKSAHLGRERYMQAIKYCARVFGKGRVSGEIVAGLEPAADSIAAIEEFAEAGAVSTVCVFRPCVGTDLQDREPPSVEEMLPVFRRAYEVCLERGILIGMAPNIKVGIVLLAEEAAGLPGVRSSPRLAVRACAQRFLRLVVRALFRAKLALNAGGKR